jgi:hypothetical protein
VPGEVDGLFAPFGENEPVRIDASRPRFFSQVGLGREDRLLSSTARCPALAQYLHPYREYRSIDLARRIEAAVDERVLRQCELGAG